MKYIWVEVMLILSMYILYISSFDRIVESCGERVLHYPHVLTEYSENNSDM